MKEVIEKRLKALIKELYHVELESVLIEKPRDEKLGDLATNIAFLLSKSLRRNPKEIGEEIANRLSNQEFSATALNGFINFVFQEGYIKEEFKKLIREGDAYFIEDLGKGSYVQVEFVSANPTGPLHLGHGRGAVVGDTIAKLLETYRYKVIREYYINDAGYQVHLLGLSILYRYMELLGVQDEEIKKVFEEEGYKGRYIRELAKCVKALYGDTLLREDKEKVIEILKDFGVKRLLEDIKEVLDEMGVRFDTWFSEKSLHESGKVEEVIRLLTEKGYTYQKDGALWFKSTEFGDDKDRVLVRSDGTPTYFASDIAYHWEKYKRGFERVINVWGADHHGYLPRLRGALEALGVPHDWLRVEFVQMVKLFSGGQEIRMSKRTGEFITLKELLEEVGKDAVRFIFLTKRSDTPLDFDMDLIKRQSSENPVFYVQYMHARIRGVLREAYSRFQIDADNYDLGDYITNLKEEQEIRLMKKTLLFKDHLREAVLRLEPHIITYELIDLAKEFHNYYNYHRIIMEDKEVMLSRLALLKGIEICVKFALKLIGVNAPERM